MFSIEYYNRAVIVSAYGIQSMNFLHIEKLRKLVLSAMKQSCEKLLINFSGVQSIDERSVEILKLIYGIATNLGIRMMVVNAEGNCCNQFELSGMGCLVEKVIPQELTDLALSVN